MITSMHIKNFKCFKDFDIELGPFNVLIGPNDSGKSAFLQVARLVGLAARHSKVHLGLAEIRDIVSSVPWEQLCWRGDPASTIRIDATVGREGLSPPHLVLTMVGSTEGPTPNLGCAWEDGAKESFTYEKDFTAWFSRALGDASFHRFVPEMLRATSPLRAPFAPSGEGFPTFLDQVNRTDREAFRRLEQSFYRRFPHYKRIELPIHDRPNARDHIALVFRTVRDELLSPEAVSDGVILSLAYLALAHQIDPPGLLLIEEPENGVHHASLKEIVGTLKHLNVEKGVQVIMTTHSPYLLDCVEPEEVHVFVKDEEGAVHSARLSDHPEVETLKKHFQTGEIWTGFDDEDIVAKRGSFE